MIFSDSRAAFKSWRDFTCEDEYDVEQAENRYERRYMERENKRMKKDLHKAEKARIKKLVDLARNKDPRVIKHEQEEKDKFERMREEKKLEKIKRREDEQRKKAEFEEADRLKKQMEEEAAKKRGDEVKAVKMAKKQRLDQIKALTGQKVKLPEYSRTFLDFFFDGVNEDEQYEVLELLNSDYDLETMRQKFREFVASVKERQSPQRKTAPVPQKDKMKDLLDRWTEDEIAALTKGMLKFPAGMGGRWDKIAGLIGGTKNIHEVTAMAKELSIKNVRGEKNIVSAMEIIISVKTEGSESPASKADTDASSKTPVDTPAVEWSQDQQKVLEQAMKKYPTSMDKKERWTKISEEIPGKTPKQCVERVKEIRDKLAKK